LLREADRLTRLFARRLEIIRLHRAGQPDRQQIAFAVARLAYGSADPIFADAIFLDVVALAPLEADADAARERRFVVMGAGRIDAEAVGRLVGHGALPARGFSRRAP
jgi:hypothetical protein